MEKIFNVKLEKDDANALLNCKSCKKKISITAGSCPQCGDRDPFCFSQITDKTKSISKCYNWFIGVLLILCIWIWVETKWWIALIVFFALGFIGRAVYNLYGKSRLENIFEGIDDIMVKILEDDAYQIWSKYAYKIYHKNDESE